MENWIHRRCLPGVAAAALVLALALAACGGGGSSSGNENTSGEATEAATTTASSSEAGLAEAEKSLQTVYEGAGFKEPPSEPVTRACAPIRVPAPADQVRWRPSR